jgi:hypothetical protein
VCSYRRQRQLAAIGFENSALKTHQL